NSALSITQTSNPTTGQALILANNNASSPSGNLLDLQKQGVSQLSVDTSGNLTALGQLTSVGLNAQGGLIQGINGLSVTGATINLNASRNFGTNINTGTSTGAVNIGNSAAGAITMQTADFVQLQDATGSNLLLADAVAGTLQTANLLPNV